MAALPSGTVTFLFTDIEGSTSRWEHQPEAMRASLARHDALVRAAIDDHHGHVVKTMGDAFLAVFVRAPDAVVAALDAQRRLQAEPWGEIGPIRVRMAVHTGAAEERDGDYYGPPLNRAARLVSAGHGGQILLSQSTYELVRDTPPDGVTFVDLGEHRLKDLIRPERVFQLVGAGLPTGFPPLRTLDARPNNLPLQTTALLGREREVADARDRLLQPEVRLLTLTGPGGTGKTRLSLQVAAELIDHPSAGSEQGFADGVFFVPLAPISDPALVPATIAQVLEIREIGRRPVLDTLNEYLRDRQMLLVLDNFEQLLSAATVVGELLAASRGLKILVTSRAPLELRGEHELPVPPLALPDPTRLPSIEALSQYAAVALFIERATSIRPGFSVTNENAPALAEICVRLDGLPLAIELAAARIRLLSPQAMLDRLDRRLSLLKGGARDLPARQQTLRGAIAWSYDLLDEGKQTLFRRLAIFVGGCTLDAVEAICDDAGDLGIDVFDGVASLVAKSLLRQEEGPDGEPRFRMLETIREYASEQLAASGEVATLRDRHLHYYLGLAEEADPELVGRRQAEWFDRLERENDNLRAALTWSCAEPGVERYVASNAVSAGFRYEGGIRLADAVEFYWVVRGRARENLSRVLSLVSLAPPGSAAKARACILAANVYKMLAEYQFALPLADEGLGLWRALDDVNGLAPALVCHGEIAQWTGDYQLATTLFTEARSLYRDIAGRSEPGAYVGLFLAEAAQAHGDDERARALYDEALAEARDRGDGHGIGYALRELARMHRGEEERGRIVALLRESLAFLQPLKDIHCAQICLEDLADALAEDGEPTVVARMLGASEGLLALMGKPLLPVHRDRHDRAVATLQHRIAPDALATAWAEGRAMTLEQATAYALERPAPM
jgi:predicted ATPase/class 3 adenylate cyclase